jgi:hypothetical protein
LLLEGRASVKLLLLLLVLLLVPGRDRLLLDIQLTVASGCCCCSPSCRCRRCCHSCLQSCKRRLQVFICSSSFQVPRPLAGNRGRHRVLPLLLLQRLLLWLLLLWLQLWCSCHASMELQLLEQLGIEARLLN